MENEDQQFDFSVKIVFYGPPGSGKTKNVEHIYAKNKHRIKGQAAMVKRVGTQRLFLDFLPLGLSTMKGKKTGVQLYTVPGEDTYNAARRLLLNGADGIVFVADSLAVRRRENIASFQNLQKNLAVQRRDISEIPLVFQYNKRDLEEQNVPLLSIDTLERDLNRLKVPAFQASAMAGINVITTVNKIISLTFASLRKQVSKD